MNPGLLGRRSYVDWEPAFSTKRMFVLRRTLARTPESDLTSTAGLVSLLSLSHCYERPS
jgi:hypothetical protein